MGYEEIHLEGKVVISPTFKIKLYLTTKSQMMKTPPVQEAIAHIPQVTNLMGAAVSVMALT